MKFEEPSLDEKKSHIFYFYLDMQLVQHIFQIK